MKRALVIGALVTAGLVLACDDDAMGPTTTGSISIRIVVDAAGAPARAGQPATAPAEVRTAATPLTPTKGPGEITQPAARLGPAQSAGAGEVALDRKIVRVTLEGSATQTEQEKQAGAATGEVPTAASPDQAQTPAPPAAPAAPSAIDNATLRVIGPTTRTLTDLAPGSTVTVDNLAVGSYTVVLEGYLGGEVDHFGIQSGVQVRSGQDTQATINFNSFRPVVGAVTSPTTAIPFKFSWPAVQNADAYIVELDDDAAFADPLVASAQITGTNAVATVVQAGTYYVRARAVNTTYVPGGGGASNYQTVDVIEDTQSGPDAANPAYLGFMDGMGPYSVVDVNILPADDEDWFSADACELDTLVVETFAQRMPEPSPLDTYLEVWDPAGTTIIAENDDIDTANQQYDSYVEVEVAADGEYLINVLGTSFGATGSYELSIDVKRGPNNDGTRCTTGPPPVTSVIVAPVLDTIATIGGTSQFSAEARDESGNPLVGVPFTWRSDDQTVATIDANGLATGLENGVTTIRAFAPNNVFGAATLVVYDVGSVGAATDVSLAAGDDQFGAPSTPLGDSLVVRVTDGSGIGVAGFSVNWAVTAGGGSISPATSITNAGGYAAAEWTLGAGTGVNTATATAAGLAGSPVTFTATATNVARWVNPVDGNWSDGTKWSTGSPPAASETAVIDVDGTYQITLDTDASVSAIALGAATGEQTLFSQFHTLTVTGDVIIAATGVFTADGTTLNVGGVVNEGLLVLNNSTVNGSLDNRAYLTALASSTVGGALATATTSFIELRESGGTDLTVTSGFSNNGTIQFTTSNPGEAPLLTVNTGTLVNASGGVIQTIGAGGGAIDGDFDNQGLVTVGDGEIFSITGTTVTNSGDMRAFSGAELDVDADFTNSGTLMTSQGATIGLYGAGFTNAVGGFLDLAPSSTLDITNGQAVFQEGVVVDSAVSIWVDGSGVAAHTVTVAGPVVVAPFGSVDLLSTEVTADQITNAGDVTLDVASIVAPVSNAGVINATVGGNGVTGTFTNNAGAWLEVDEPGAELAVTGNFVNDGTIKLYSSAAGTSPTLTVSGTLVNNQWFDSEGPAGGILNADSIANTGELHAVAGPTFTVNTRTLVSPGSFAVDGSDLALIADSVVSTGFVGIANGWTLYCTATTTCRFAGEIAGSGSINVTNATFLTSAILHPGDTDFGNLGSGQVGTLDIIGDMTMTGGFLNVDLNGVAAGEFDLLNVSGSMTLAGELHLNQGFTPGASDTFQVINYASHSGQFATVTGNAVGGGLVLVPLYGATNVTLAVQPAAASVVVTPSGASLLSIGATQQFSAEARDTADAPLPGKQFVWASLNPDVATVDQTGLVTAVASGQTPIAATTDGNVVGYAVVTVAAPGAAPLNLGVDEPSPAAWQLMGIWGSSESDIWAGGMNGDLLHYDGANWTSPSIGVLHDHVWAVWGSSASDVYIAGNTVTGIIHFDGVSWGQSFSPADDIRGGWAGSPSISVAVGDVGAIYRFDGASWVTDASGTIERLNGVWGASATDIFAVGENGTILHYDGSSWSPMTSGVSDHLQAVWGTAGNDVYAVGGGTILHYDGANWTQMGPSLPALFQAIWGTSSTDIYASGNAEIYAYHGSSWTRVFTVDPSVGLLQGIWGPPGNNTDAFVIGDAYIGRGFRGATLQVTPPGVTLASPGATQTLTAQAYDWMGNPLSGISYDWSSSNTRVATVDAVSGLVTGQADGQATITVAAGSLAEHSVVTVLDPGATPVNIWNDDPDTGITPDYFYDVWGSADNDVFATGQNGMVYHYNGSSWSQMSTGGITNWMWSLWGFGPSDVYAVGTGGMVLQYDGLGWTPMSGTGSQNLFGIWGSSPSDLVAVGLGGHIMRYDGTSWNTETSSTSDNLYDVWGTAPNDVFAVGLNGSIVHWDGLSWSTMVNPAAGNSLWSVWGTQPSEVFAVGDGGTILRYDGNNWATMTSPTASNLREVWGVASDEVYAVGDGGVILRYDGSSWIGMANPSSATLRGMWGTAAGDVYAAGVAGALRRGLRGATMSATPDLSFVHTMPATAMSVASDGSFYYTSNGGISSSGTIERYSLVGAFVDSTMFTFDGRTLVYNPVDRLFYTKNFGTDWFQVDPATGVLTTVHSGIFTSSQSSPALTPDGVSILEHSAGTVHVYSAATGTETGTLTNIPYGSTGQYAIATDGNYIFTWDNTTRTVSVSGLSGYFVTSFVLPNGDNGYSLSYSNGRLWVEEGSTNTWYSYILNVVP